MAIDIARLEGELMRMSVEGAPGREFCEAISVLAGSGRIKHLQDILPAVVYAELKERFEQSPADFVAGWRMLGRKMQQGFVQHARQRLTSLTRLQQSTGDANTPAWQQIPTCLGWSAKRLIARGFCA